MTFQIPQLGTDIHLDRIGQFLITAGGDTDLCGDETCLMQDVVHRLTTPLGGLFYDPAYGLDIYRFLHMDGSPLSRYELCQSVREQLQLEPRILRDSIQVSVLRWDAKSVHLAIQFAWIDGTTPANLVWLSGVGGAWAAYPVSPVSADSQTARSGWPAGFAPPTGPVAWYLNASSALVETPTGALDGSNAAYLLTAPPVPGTLQVYWNGQYLSPSHYVLEGRLIRMETPLSGGELEVTYFRQPEATP